MSLRLGKATRLEKVCSVLEGATPSMVAHRSSLLRAQRISMCPVKGKSSSDMSLGLSGSLSSLVARRFAAARLAEALVFSHTEVRTIAVSKIPVSRSVFKPAITSWLC